VKSFNRIIAKVVGQPSRLPQSGGRAGCRDRRNARRTTAAGTAAPLAVAALMLFAPTAARACAVCFGNSDSQLSKGMMAGVLVLLFVVLAVLGGFVALFVHIARRSAAVALEESSAKIEGLK